MTERALSSMPELWDHEHLVSESMIRSGASPAFGWSLVRQSLSRPCRVTVWMVLLVMMIPFYLVIAQEIDRSGLHVPRRLWTG